MVLRPQRALLRLVSGDARAVPQPIAFSQGPTELVELFQVLQFQPFLSGPRSPTRTDGSGLNPAPLGPEVSVAEGTILSGR